MSRRLAAVLVTLIVAAAAVACVWIWTTNLRYEIAGSGYAAAYVLDRKTGEMKWYVRGQEQQR